ncbi:hypothetical protein [Actinoplanes regularis]|nr:hypothetical protein [Actinoplanes regularis]
MIAAAFVPALPIEAYLVAAITSTGADAATLGRSAAERVFRAAPLVPEPA